jgi:hypothetical protein
MSAARAGGSGAPTPSGSDNPAYVNQAGRDRTGVTLMPINGRLMETATEKCLPIFCVSFGEIAML